MGMFDHVAYAHTCTCGEIVTGFQSKDGPCELLSLTALQVSNFYSSCHNCNTWWEFNRTKKEPPEFGSLEDYYRVERDE